MHAGGGGGGGGGGGTVPERKHDSHMKKIICKIIIKSG